MKPSLVAQTLFAIALLRSPAAVREVHIAAETGAREISRGTKCDVTGTTKITITCDYTPAPRDANASDAVPRIALNHAVLSFETNDESHMKIELTFTNQSAAAFSEPRTVFIAIDEPSGKNHVRRPLPQVDLRKLEPHQTLTFSEILLSPAFPRGDYVVHLWIPSSDPALKFDATHNLLLGNIGVPDSVTGLNTLANFNVTAWPDRKSRPH
jgi:Domain of unknown function (DUF4832)